MNVSESYRYVKTLAHKLLFCVMKQVCVIYDFNDLINITDEPVLVLSRHLSECSNSIPVLTHVYDFSF